GVRGGLEENRQKVVREWGARNIKPDPAAAYAFLPPDELSYPWLLGDKEEKPSDDDAKRRDACRSLFMPSGAILAGRTDDRSWLTAGCGDLLPVMALGNT